MGTSMVSILLCFRCRSLEFNSCIILVCIIRQLMCHSQSLAVFVADTSPRSRSYPTVLLQACRMFCDVYLDRLPWFSLSAGNKLRCTGSGGYVILCSFLCNVFYNSE